MSERRACQLANQPRGTQRYQPTQREDEDRLTQAIIVLASQYGAGTDRLAYVPPHVPFVAGRDGCSNESATRTDAARFDPDDHECLWTGDAGFREGSQWKGCRNGTHPCRDECLKSANFLIGSFWESVRRDQSLQGHKYI